MAKTKKIDEIDWVRIAGFSYPFLLVLIAVLPINGGKSVINNTYIIQIRLDYLLHGIIFVPWILIIGLAFKPKSVINLIFGLSLAIFAEGIQYFLPYRTFNVNDLISNSFGVLSGFVFILPSVSKRLFVWLRIPLR